MAPRACRPVGAGRAAGDAGELALKTPTSAFAVTPSRPGARNRLGGSRSRARHLSSAPDPRMSPLRADSQRRSVSASVAVHARAVPSHQATAACLTKQNGLRKGMRTLGMLAVVIAGLCAAGCGGDSKGRKPEESLRQSVPAGSVEIPASDVPAMPEPTRRPELPEPAAIALPGMRRPAAAETPGTSPDRSPNEAPAPRPAGSSRLGGPCTSAQECESGLSCFGNQHACPSLEKMI